jgi:hypothetical protein
MKISILIALSTLILLMSSCSDDLSRSRAKELIIAKSKLPMVESEYFDQVLDESLPQARAILEGYRKLEADGYITVSKCECGFGQAAYCTEFTDKGKAFITGKGHYGGVCSQPIPMRVAELEFGEVTGIRREGESTKAIVSYTIRRKDITPFGVFLKLEAVIQGPDITFAKYDDGWRMTN